MKQHLFLCEDTFPSDSLTIQMVTEKIYHEVFDLEYRMTDVLIGKKCG